MSKHWIKNFDDLATTEIRRHTLEIAEAGLDAISTEQIIESSIRIADGFLMVKDHSFELKNFDNIRVIGFGKASSRAAKALEKVLGDKLTDGIVIDKELNACEIIKVHRGTHPRPSLENYQVAKEIVNLAEKSSEKDLVIVIVSGGGSALLCWPEEECIRGQELYDSFLKTGETINELNTVRKHTSLVKGGGLAKILYPATVIGLILSDIPGEKYDQVASGPTYKDSSTKSDAEAIVKKLQLGNFELIETPKEDKYFERVHNFVLVSNITAIEAMAEKAKALGYSPQTFSFENYAPADETISAMASINTEKSVVLAGGEIRLKVDKAGGSGGRNSFLVLKAVSRLESTQVLLSIASDGIDNGESAGAIADESSLKKIKENGLDLEDFINRYYSHDLFEKIKDTVYTGPTGANVSDLIILLKK
jgi:glycerate-2-kinase